MDGFVLSVRTESHSLFFHEHSMRSDAHPAPCA